VRVTQELRSARRAGPTFIVALLFIGIASAPLAAATAPAPTAVSADERQALTDGLAQLRRDLTAAERAVANDPKLRALLPDVQVLAKTLDWSLNFDAPFASALLPTAKEILREGLDRAAQLRAGRAPWTTRTGKVIRGFRSRLDDSVQPYVINVPPDWTPAHRTPRPLFLECPGAGLVTELKVIDAGLNGGNGFADEKSFHLRAYTRGYNAAKFAGEVNIFEQLAHAQSQYPVDERRIVLHGFSMGGSGTWHLAAHHPDRWVVALPGAGFANTEHYVKIWEWEKPPPPWHVTLFHYYNATDVAGNIAMVPTFAYAGEMDDQRFSHDAMAAACARDGVPLRRVIGLNTGHRYEQTARAEVEAWMRPFVSAGRPKSHPEVRYSTFGLRYDRCEWVRLDHLDEHWKRADIHARIESPNFIRINTANVSTFTLDSAGAELPLAKDKPVRLSIDGQYLDVPAIAAPWRVSVHKKFRAWPEVDGRTRSPTEVWALGAPPGAGLHKVHGLTGPVDDAFMARFLFVRPTGKAMNEKIGAWVATEIDHAQKMWRTLYRGEVLIKDDRDVTAADIATCNLILWGDPQSNALIARVLPKLPLTWTAAKLTLAGQESAAANHAPILIYPNPLNPLRYVVLNSGPTQRRGLLADQGKAKLKAAPTLMEPAGDWIHDLRVTTSALVTPKLPDFALINLDTPPDGAAPGAIVRTGFFNESWQLPRPASSLP
jgi:dienelactone hydrolase